METLSIKQWNKTAYPKALLSIAASVAGLALFLFLASTFLVSQPIGSTVRGYFYGVDSSGETGSSNIVGPNEGVDGNGVVSQESGDVDNHQEIKGTIDSSGEAGSSDIAIPSEGGKLNPNVTTEDGSGVVSQDSGQVDNPREIKRTVDSSGEAGSSDIAIPSEGGKLNPNVTTGDGNGVVSQDSGQVVNLPEIKGTGDEDLGKSKSSNDAVFSNASVSYTNMQTETTENVESSANSVSDCDLSQGKWIHDPNGPLYTNNSCPVITQMQNCQGNGRPDKDYENWRWKPSQCDVPRFDPKQFLELMKGKTLAFIGDSVARNQFESMLCILWQVEAPKNRGNKKMQRYYFRSTSTMIVRIWSSWLVHQSTEPLDSAPSSVVKLHLDIPDEKFMEHISDFDVIVLSSGHWFAKQSAYVLNNEIVGGQLWKSKKNKLNNIEAFGVSVETILTSIGTHPNFTGLTIVRSFSPDHYEGGAWNTGGSCTGKVRPANDGEVVENAFTNIMHEKQVGGFDRALKKQTNGAKLKLLDITGTFSYRVDGHPGPYRDPNPNKVTKRGPDGKPPPQDCLHWCMPGPVDTWNELVFEIIRREV